MFILIYLLFMEKKFSIKEVLANMQVGEEKSFPAEKMYSVSTTCSDYGFITGRRYRTRRDRVSGTIKVTRVK